MIESGLNALRETQRDILAKPVVYRRGGESRPIKAIPAKTIFRSTNEYGAWVRTEARDFIVPYGELDIEPEKGDVIEFLGGEYEVLAPANEPVWRWSDPYHTAMRIHTKHVGGVQ